MQNELKQKKTKTEKLSSKTKTPTSREAPQTHSSKIQPKLIKDPDGDNDYELDQAVHHLSKAEEIKANPELMKKVQGRVKNKITSIDGLKKLYNEKFNKASYEQEKKEEGM